MPKRILVVEDDIDIRENLKLFYEEEGYSVEMAEHGNEALNYLAHTKTPPELIILDLMMPELDGVDFLKKLRNDVNNPARQTPVAVVTAAPLRGERELSIRPLASELIKKPFSVDRLLDVAKRYCG